MVLAPGRQRSLRPPLSGSGFQPGDFQPLLDDLANGDGPATTPMFVDLGQGQLALGLRDGPGSLAPVALLAG